MSITTIGGSFTVTYEENLDLVPQLAERLAREAKRAAPLQFLPKSAKGATPVDTSWIDEPQLELVEAGSVRGFVEPEPPVVARRAGPRPDAVRAADAKR